MQAGIYRLKHLGISGVLPSSISSAMSRLPDEAIVLAAASHIERELQITPWSLSSNFFACVVQVKYVNLLLGNLYGILLIMCWRLAVLLFMLIR